VHIETLLIKFYPLQLYNNSLIISSNSGKFVTIKLQKS
jgi:hypothetical protein